MKKSKFIIILVCFFILLYVVFKGILFYHSDLFMNNNIYDKQYPYAKVLNINKGNTDDNIKIKNIGISINNFIKDYKVTDKQDNYIRYDNDKSSVILIKTKDNISQINSTEIDSIFSELYYYPMYISETLRNHFLKEHNIKTDVDLIKYIRKRKREKSTIFTSIIKIKENYFYDFIETSIYNNIDNITYIEGDYLGYIIDYTDYKEVNILKDSYIYKLVFMNKEEFNNNKINEIISSIE